MTAVSVEELTFFMGNSLPLPEDLLIAILAILIRRMTSGRKQAGGVSNRRAMAQRGIISSPQQPQ